MYLYWKTIALFMRAMHNNSPVTETQVSAGRGYFNRSGPEERNREKSTNDVEAIAAPDHKRGGISDGRRTAWNG